MYFILFSAKYLLLRTEKGWLVLWRDVIPVILVSGSLFTFFLIFERANFFGTDGFFDKLGSLTSTLTGFYVAGLLAVAAFAAPGSALDDAIEVGPVFYGRENSPDRERLTRRQYVCSMFGYLAFLSLILSVLSVASSGLAAGASGALQGITWQIAGYVIDAKAIVRSLVELAVLVPMSHLIVTTGYGMYYISHKVYDKKPTITGRR